MEVRKGPYGHFIYDRVDEKTQINEYAIEMINEGILGNFLPVYIFEHPGYKEISYDYSGYKSIREIEECDVNTSRKAISDLFFSFHRSLDLLFPLNNVNIDERYIFTNNDMNKLFLCYKPYFNSTNMTLSNINGMTIESLLNTRFFKSALTNDEKNQLIYAINNNNETLYLKACKSIEEKIPANKEIKKGKLKNVIFIILIIVSIAAYFILGLIPSIVLVVISLVYVTTEIIQTKKHKNNKITHSSMLHESRKQVLFETNTKQINNTLNCIFIESTEKINGEFIKNAIYTPKATIGSDFFLSDICINDNSVSPLNAEITLNNSTYFIKDISGKCNILVEGVKLIPNKNYEIKNGQTVTIGRINLKIRIGLE